MHTRIATVLLLGLAGVSVPASAGEWTGAYIGIGAGIGAANHELSFEEAPGIPFNGSLSIDGLGGDGALFTLGVGADYQVNSRLVVGALFDYDWVNLETDIFDLNIGPPVGLSVNSNVEVEDVWSIGGRAGYLVTPSTLLFLSAGYSRADVSDITAGAAGIGSITLAKVGDFDGYFIGGGAEVKLTKALSIKGEYRYTDFSDEVITLLPGTPFAGINDIITTKLDPDIQTARVALNYRFGLGGPGDDVTQESEPEVGSWSQLYVSAGGAYAFANNELTLSPGPALAPFGVDAALSFDGLGSQGGGFTLGLGVDRQYDDKFVFGLFVDYTRHSSEYEITLDLLGIISGSLGYDIEDELSIGGRVGYLLTPSTLVFGSVGYSHLWLSDTVVSGSIADLGFIGPASGSFRLADNGSVDGVFLGAGFETKLTNSLSLKAEYRYLFGDQEQITLLPDLLPDANAFVTTEIDPAIQTVRLSLDYRFNFGGE